MRFIDIIEKKKEGSPLTKEELHFFIQNYVSKRIPEYQVSAFLMAVCFQSMNAQETAWLCEEMLKSGDTIDLSMIDGIVCDKHSTGGVGDKTSLALAPMVAACGVKIAKMSGRGLGHTGGTLDKLESIPGFKIDISEKDFIQQVREIGIAIISQSSTLVPADKSLYALRDVTATVDSIPLIASSIMSKKLACGADTILLDVKYGEGAFMKTPTDAKKLAKEMIAIGKYFHKDTKALISDMNQPLGNAIGNALEVKEAINTLKGNGPKDFLDLCLKAGSIMLVQANIAKNMEDAKIRLLDVINSQAALRKLKEMISFQHGDARIIEEPDLLPKAKYVMEMKASKNGIVHSLHAMKLGTLAMQLGAGRSTKDDIIDPSVGIVLNKKAGDYVEIGDILAFVHCNQELTGEWKDAFMRCYEISSEEVQEESLIEEILG